MKRPSSSFFLRPEAFGQVYEYSRNHCVQFGGDRKTRLGAAIFCLTGMGLVYQSVATIVDRLKHPAPVNWWM